MNRQLKFHLPPIPSIPLFSLIAHTCGVIVLAIGIVGLAGWVLDIAILRSVFAGLATLKANTAICFIASGIALYLIAGVGPAPLNRRVATLLVVGVLGISALTLLEYVQGADFGIDQLLFSDYETPPDAYPGRMSPATALCFVLVTISILGIVRLEKYWPGQILAAAVVFISLAALVGYIFRVESLYSTLFFNTMALHTALGFLFLGIGVLHTYPTHGFMMIFLDLGPAGRMARWLVPSAVFLPVLLGWLIGQGANNANFDIVFAFDLLILSSIFVFTGVIGWNAYITRRTDRARRAAEAALGRRNQAYRTLSSCNQTLIRADARDDLLNQICENITHIGGYVAAWCGMVKSPDEVLVASISVRPGLAVPENGGHAGTVDPDCVREFTLKALTTEKVQEVVDLVRNAPSCLPEAERLGYGSIGLLPIRDKGTVFGVLHVYSADATGFDEQEIGLLMELSRDLGYGITTLQMQQAHQMAEARVRYQASLLENISDAVIAADLEFNIRSWNKAAENVYGWEAAEVIGAAVNAILQSELIGDSFENILDHLHSRGQWQGEMIQRHRDGAKVRILSSMTPIVSPDGEMNGVVLVNRDITEYMAMRERLMEVEMERRELEKEREMVALKEQLIATITHDFRTPLAVIITSSDLMTRYRERFSQEQWYEHIARIRDQADYMTELLDDVLLLSKARSGKAVFQPRDVNLEAFCATIFEQAQVEALPTHRFSFTAEGELASSRIDEHILQRVLLNLLSNAVKYSPDGGEIGFHVRREADDVLFTISDEGVGIPVQDQNHIFEPFHRARNTGDIQGTGLGMAIVYESVKSYGGTISLESEEGQGTTFTVRLPYRQEHL